MEHQNKKSIIPGFSAAAFPAQFAGLQSNGANALMSTLQTLQIHGLGNSILPSTNMTTAEFSQRVLIEQMKAMQTMYSSFGLKAPDSQNSNGAGTSSNTACYEKNGTSAKLTTANTIFSNNTNFLSSNDLQTLGVSASTPVDKEKMFKEDNGTIINASSSSMNETNIGLNHSAAKGLSATKFQSKNVCNLNLQTANGFPNSTTYADEWMKTIHFDKFNDKVTEINRQTPINTIPSTSNATFPIRNSEMVSDLLGKKDDTIETVKDTARDDVEDIFGLSNLDDGVGQITNDTGIFGLPSNGGLSPVEFTPPDSPTEALTTDFLFGLEPVRTNSTPASCSSQPSTSAAPALNNKEDKNSDGFKVPEAPAADPAPTPPPINKEPVYRSIVKSNKVPVYKQKLNTLTKNEKETKKGADYDAFEFEDDDENDTLKPQNIKEKDGDIFAQCDAKSKNVYVPGIGFAISNEAPSADLWRHVVPKKRPHGDSRQLAPGSSLLPSSALHEAQIAARLTDGAIVTLAESIRLRRNQRATNQFISVTMSNDTDCSKNIKRVNRNSNQPLLPKFIIKISRLYDTSEGVAPKKKRKKKKSEDEEDSDWDDFVHRRKRKTGKKIYELREVDSAEVNEKDDNYGASKRVRVNGCPVNTRSNSSNNRNNQIDSVKHRLSKFGSAEGFLPKGTYVVCKADLLKEDCALWRVDNQNLLQKFPPRLDLAGNKLIYKSSSTYSGWCEQISGQYFRVSVRVLKQSRSETTIEPEIPLNELFPAMSEEILKNPRTIQIQDAAANKVEDVSLSKDTQRISLHTFMTALLDHSLTQDYLETIQQKSDWTFLRSVTEIDQANNEAESRIRDNVIIETKFTDLLKKYTRLVIYNEDYYTRTFCQICNRKKTKKILLFFDKLSYDEDTLKFNIDDEQNDDTDKEDFLPSIDLFSCPKCAKACEYLHKLYHLKLNLLRVCEDKLEFVGTEHLEIAPERIVEVVKKDKSWIGGVVGSYCDLWRRIKNDFQ